MECGINKKELWKIWITSLEKGKKSPKESRDITAIKHSRLRCGPHTITATTSTVLIKGDTLKIVVVKAAFMLLNFSSCRT